MASTKILGAGIASDIVLSGVVTASNFKTGVSNLHDIGIDVGSAATIRSTGNASFTGIVTAQKFVGDASLLTGISGFGNALNATENTLGNLVYKTPEAFTIAAGTSVSIASDNASGNVAFTRLRRINVGTGSTLQIGAGTTFKMDVLGIFP
tara:strand:- start:29 stop:481 length:453 start_codon:yes stop_codon:yes gene_type:complete